MGKLIFNAQSTPVAPVGENKHTMFVDSCDGKLKMENSNGCVDTILCYTEPTPDYIVASYIVVGGGGGGGGGGLSSAGGGGGGGGLVYFKCNELLKKGEYPITIGIGGTGGSGWTCGGTNGGDTIFNGYIAYGGGGGGSSTDSTGTPRGPACDGGNGGGAGGYCGTGTNCFVGFHISYIGHDGGAGGNSAGGGGGGAVTQGGINSYNMYCGILSGPQGGRGLLNGISGTNCYYGGGGNGNSGGTNNYGGGNGGACNSNGGNGKRYGGGGGGAGWCSGTKGGDGYQGVVIISYPEACNYNVIGGTITCCNGNKIHTFTTNGTLCIN